VSAAARVASLAGRLSSVAQLLGDVEGDVRALSHDSAAAAAGESDVLLGQWLPGIADAVQRMQLECADAQFAARALRHALPGTGTLQPRLL
jgi:hypothetical protein